MEKILIFGATGTVGAYAALHLKELGYEVFAVGRRKSDNGFFKDHDIKYISCDISKVEDFEILPTKIDVIFHFAGMMPAKMSGYSQNAYVDSIFSGTLNILNYAVASKVERFVFAQSIADIQYLFGTTEPISPDVEMKNPLVGDHAIYSICKNASVNLIQHYAATYNFKHFILRFPTIYAYRESPFYFVDGKEKWLGYRLIIDNAMKGKDIAIWGDPSKKKDMVYIKDLLSILEGTISTSYKGGIYNVGTGIGTSLEEFIRSVITVFSPKSSISPVTYLPNKPSSPQFVLDISKTIRELNYNPQYLSSESWLMDFKVEMNTHKFKRLYE